MNTLRNRLKMQLNLNDLVDEFLRLEKYNEESKAFESLAAVPNLSSDEMDLEKDWQQFLVYKFNKAGIHQGLLEAVRKGYLLIAQKLTQAMSEHTEEEERGSEED